MRLRDRLERLRWMLVPIAAYVAITLVMPAAHGAAARRAFPRHAMWVLVGCVAIAAAVVVVGIARDAARNIWRSRRVGDRP